MSLKLVRAIRKLGCSFLFAFYSNCGRTGICRRLCDIQCQIMAYATFYWSATVNIALP